MIHIITRRCPSVELTVFPAAVQGKDSVPELLAAFAAVRKLADRFDTVILCRGGGSMEDLMSFNDERVVRAVFACPIPVISGMRWTSPSAILRRISGHPRRPRQRNWLSRTPCSCGGSWNSILPG